jgi:hypothetical protein
LIYKKPEELMGPDALSRIHEDDGKRRKARPLRQEKQRNIY